MVIVQTQSTPTNDDDPAFGIKSSIDASSPLKADTQFTDSVRSTSDATEAESDDEQLSPTAAKASLRALLEKHSRSAKHPEVIKAVEELAAMNPSRDAAEDPNLEGSFVTLTRPEFPGKIKQEPGTELVDQYTLGRMSFNIFQPSDLVCTIVSTQNDLIMAPNLQQQPEEGVVTLAYPLVSHIIIHTPKGDFPASIRMEAVCTSKKQPKNRLGVTFLGGSLTPAQEVLSDYTKLNLWKEVFAGAYQKAEAKRSYLSAFMQFIFKWMFQLTTPTDKDALASESCAVRFEMKRSPTGYFDVLYLDEDMRITRGNRGTLVILERIDTITTNN